MKQFIIIVLTDHGLKHNGYMQKKLSNFNILDRRVNKGGVAINTQAQ